MRNTDDTADKHARRKASHWIYRYKDGGACVIPSRSTSEEDCWNFAIHALRPAWMKDDAEADRYMHEIGEVIKDDDE